MLQIDPVAATAVQPDLTPGETLLWAGRPLLGAIFHRDDLYLIPFSLMWGGFAIFWEGGVAGYWGHQSKAGTPWTFGVIWGIPFVLVGQYIIWGRFLFAAWRKRRTFYAVTNRRVIVVQTGSTRQMASAFIDTLPTLVKESRSGTAGTLRFAEPEALWSRRRSRGPWDTMALGSVPVFADIEDVDGLYRLVAELRERTTSARRAR